MTAPAPAVPLLVDDLDSLEAAVDAGLAVAIDALAALRAREAHRARGFASHGEYLVARFGEALRRLRLDREDTLAVVDHLARPAEGRKPMPTRRIAELLGVSNGSAQNFKVDLGLAPAPAAKPEPLPAPTGRVWQQTVEYLRRHPAGLTLVELAAAARWTEGKASGALTDVVRRGLVERTEERRANQRVHRLLPE